jgi:precorrin-6B methylase 2
MINSRRSVSIWCFWCALLSGILALIFSTVAWTPAAADEPSRYEVREEHDLYGIGKFYMGREIARVVGPGEVVWLDRPQREAEERISLMVESLGLKPGMAVADVGAGSGRISLMMAPLVGEQGKVYAVDISQKMLDYLSDKLNRQDVKNVELVLATAKSPELKPESVDLALMVDVYHELEFPYESMLAMSKAIRPGGRVVLVEFRKEDPKVPIKLVHKMTEAQVKKELLLPEFGLKWKETIGVLPWQHIVVFEKKSAS